MHQEIGCSLFSRIAKFHLCYYMETIHLITRPTWKKTVFLLLSFSTNRVLQDASLCPYVEGLVGPLRPSPGLGSKKEPSQKQAKSNDVWHSFSLDLSGYDQLSITSLHQENINTLTDLVPCEFHLPIPKMHLFCVLWSFQNRER